MADERETEEQARERALKIGDRVRCVCPGDDYDGDVGTVVGVDENSTEDGVLVLFDTDTKYRCRYEVVAIDAVPIIDALAYARALGWTPPGQCSAHGCPNRGELKFKVSGTLVCREHQFIHGPSVPEPLDDEARRG